MPEPEVVFLKLHGALKIGNKQVLLQDIGEFSVELVISEVPPPLKSPTEIEKSLEIDRKIRQALGLQS
ncbi:MAG: hypothetical protein HYT48_03005 [Candidatus Vogelbacteria bacterium]|nr:hypothetical protein [Candidatus Vogelbacteria bacterium]